MGHLHLSLRSLVFVLSLSLLIGIGMFTSPMIHASTRLSNRSAREHFNTLSKWQANATSAPAYTTSIYESTTDIATLYNQGCSAAKGAPGVIVLDWGQPVFLNGSYGTFDFGKIDVTVDDILHATANFAQGVWDCRTPQTNIALAVGESNNSYDGLTLTDAAWYGDGQAWGTMVNQLQSFLVNQQYANVVGAYGAGDLETQWTNFQFTSDLVKGYNSASSQLYFDFGDDAPGWWNNYQVWYVANGAPDDVPLPEVYSQALADEWEQLSIWACNNEGGPLYIKGAMAESAGDNTPDLAYEQMYNDEASNSCTAPALSWLIFSTNI